MANKNTMRRALQRARREREPFATEKSNPLVMAKLTRKPSGKPGA